jgi:hypothetical protein
MRPGEVLDAQVDLIDRLDSTQFEGYLNSVYAMDETGHLDDDDDAPVRSRLNAHQSVAATLQRHVKASYAYRVTEDMSALIQHGAALLDEDDRLDTTLAPTQAGFVGFDKPLPVREVRGHIMLIHWMSWGPARTTAGDTGMVVWMFNDVYREPDEIALATEAEDPESAQAMRTVGGRWAPVATTPIINGRSVGPPEVAADPDKYPDLVPSSNPIRYVHALWLLLNQTVTATREEDVERPSRRRAQRRQLHPTVTVVALRREFTPNHTEGETHVDRDFKWLVRGHWRWQVCGQGYPGAVQRDDGQWRSRIWINGYVKGDPSAPLRVTEKVYDLRR